MSRLTAINPVGASLLAMRPSHPASMSTDTPPSRASSLPPWIGVRRINSGQHHPPVGAGLLAMRPAHPASKSANTQPSQASPLPPRNLPQCHHEPEFKPAVIDLP